MKFQEFGTIPRLKREIVITEKIDGANAAVVFNDDGTFSHAQSRNRIITPDNDNFGFAGWVQDNLEELTKLGPGYHFGEWWGQGIGRGYGLKERRFSLFNAFRWNDQNPNRPGCCHVVPMLCTHTDFEQVGIQLARLRTEGSIAAPGFASPEGLILYHGREGYFKVTLERDDEWKGKKS